MFLQFQEIKQNCDIDFKFFQRNFSSNIKRMQNLLCQSGIWVKVSSEFKIDFDWCTTNYITKIWTKQYIFYSILQLTPYTAYRSLQKITNLMVRHLTRPHFLESCGHVMLLWRCLTTEKASRFRSKVLKIVAAKQIL